jgi:outer membrane protein assembly factor BamB
LPKRALFAFDRASGKILWAVGGQVNEREFLKKASFPMPPVIEKDTATVYAAAVYAENDTDLPQHYICAFNASTGELYWKTFITSGLLEINLFNNPAREIIGSALTIDNDTIYYCSNIGVVTAVDKFSGSVKWVKKYQQFEVPPTRNEYPAHLPLLWVNNPLLKMNYGSDKSALLVTPVDSAFLYALNPETGEEIWKWDGFDLGNIRYMLGTKGELLYLQGESNSICLNVAKEGKRVWVYPGPFRGKGGLAENAVYFSTPDSLAMVHPTSGKILNIWNWANLQTHPGNIIIRNNQMLTTSKDTINLFIK